MGEMVRDAVVLLETNLDNATGELLGWLMEYLLESGALDVNYLPMQMKKNRPAILVRVLARPDDAERIARLLLQNTPTLGVRMTPIERLIAERELRTVISPWGTLVVKIKRIDDDILTVAPEYADLRRLAKELSLPLGDLVDRIESWLHDEFLQSLSD